ncbi:MAG: NAD-dependent deacylase [Calditrichia bacterium]
MEFSERFLERIKHASSVVVLTGAGISAASGVPTFRGADGLWKKFKPEELANFDAFSRNPELVWEWYNWRRDLIKKVQPNVAHYTLVDIENMFPEFTLITQNVDNLHRVAGSKNILELHGNIMRNKCSECQTPYEGEFDLEAGIPRCPKCNGLIRPDVVWFGEILPFDVLHAAQEASMQCDIFFSIGTSSVVEPAASLPFIAKGNGAFVVEINTENTPLTESCDEHLRGEATKILPELLFALQKVRE